jgi:hypothetical protein
MPTKFGNGRKTCKVCDADLKHYKVLTIKIKHQTGGQMMTLRHFVPLCPKHWYPGCLETEMGWETDEVPVDEVVEDPS